MIKLEEVKNEKELKEFVKFPFSLYKNNKCWVPPLIKDEIKSFKKDKNPVFKNVDARIFVAKRNNEIVGRIVAIINHNEVEKQGIEKMRFGWFDVIDDIKVSEALINKVKEIGKENNLEFIEGPVGFNNLDKTGVLVEGFDHIGTMITWYNHPYYKDHLEQLGFVKEKEYIENKFNFKDVEIDYYKEVSRKIKEELELTPKNFTSSKEIMPYVDEMFEVFSETYSKLSTFVPISDKQIQHFKKKYIKLLNPEFIKFIFDKNGRIISFAIVMPSFSKALQKANGKLFPFGFIHLLRAKKVSKDVIFYLIGIKTEYQSKGLTSIIFEEYYNTFLEKGVETCINTPMLADNKKIQNIWKPFKPVIHKRRRTYRLDL
ncbi:MAG: GTP cyclohydrolase [Tenacibaculum sp.]|nr:GTP cyclohydrolase [Tenacibaculum sp.]